MAGTSPLHEPDDCRAAAFVRDVLPTHFAGTIESAVA
jgi:hypothetical protein